MNEENRGRYKRVYEHPNLLFDQWLKEWMSVAEAKESNMKYNYRKAIKSLKKYPLPVYSGSDCLVLTHFGTKICAKIDKKIEEHEKLHGFIDWDDYIKVIEYGKKRKRTGKENEKSKKLEDKTSTKDRQPGNKEDNNISQSEKSKTKPYKPMFRTGSYAILLSLYEAAFAADYKGYLTKEELIDRAQELCDSSFILAKENTRYTAWASMGSLIKRMFVSKYSSPARYSLTAEGSLLASTLSRNSDELFSRSSQNSTQSNQSTLESCSNQSTTVRSSSQPTSIRSSQSTAIKSSHSTAIKSSSQSYSAKPSSQSNLVHTYSNFSSETDSRFADNVFSSPDYPCAAISPSKSLLLTYIRNLNRKKVLKSSEKSHDSSTDSKTSLTVPKITSKVSKNCLNNFKNVLNDSRALASELTTLSNGFESDNILGGSPLSERVNKSSIDSSLSPLLSPTKSELLSSPITPKFNQRKTRKSFALLKSPNDFEPILGNNIVENRQKSNVQLFSSESEMNLDNNNDNIAKNDNKPKLKSLSPLKNYPSTSGIKKTVSSCASTFTKNYFKSVKNCPQSKYSTFHSVSSDESDLKFKSKLKTESDLKIEITEVSKGLKRSSYESDSDDFNSFKKSKKIGNFNSDENGKISKNINCKNFNKSVDAASEKEEDILEEFSLNDYLTKNFLTKTEPNDKIITNSVKLKNSQQLSNKKKTEEISLIDIDDDDFDDLITKLTGPKDKINENSVKLKNSKQSSSKKKTEEISLIDSDDEDFSIFKTLENQYGIKTEYRRQDETLNNNGGVTANNNNNARANNNNDATANNNNDVVAINNNATANNNSDSTDFIYVSSDSVESRLKSDAHVKIDEENGVLLFLIKAKFLDLLKSKLDYEIVSDRDALPGYTYAYVSDLCAPELILSESADEFSGYRDFDEFKFDDRFKFDYGDDYFKKFDGDGTENKRKIKLSEMKNKEESKFREVDNDKDCEKEKHFKTDNFALGNEKNTEDDCVGKSKFSERDKFISVDSSDEDILVDNDGPYFSNYCDTSDTKKYSFSARCDTDDIKKYSFADPCDTDDTKKYSFSARCDTDDIKKYSSICSDDDDVKKRSSPTCSDNDDEAKKCSSSTCSDNDIKKYSFSIYSDKNDVKKYSSPTCSDIDFKQSPPTARETCSIKDYTSSASICSDSKDNDIKKSSFSTRSYDVKNYSSPVCSDNEFDEDFNIFESSTDFLNRIKNKMKESKGTTESNKKLGSENSKVSKISLIEKNKTEASKIHKKSETDVIDSVSNKLDSKKEKVSKAGKKNKTKKVQDVETSSQESLCSVPSFSDVNKYFLNSQGKAPNNFSSNAEKIGSEIRKEIYSKDDVLFTLSRGSFDIVLNIDNQEVLGGVPGNKKKSLKTVMIDELKKYNVKYKIRRLNIGDYLWTCEPNFKHDNISNSQPVFMSNNSQFVSQNTISSSQELPRKNSQKLPRSSSLENNHELVLPYVIERKRMDDLASSILDGRFSEQKFRLKTCGLSRPIYLVEKYGSENASLPVSSCEQAILNTQIVDGFSIKMATDMRETAMYLAVMTRFLQNEYSSKTLHGVSMESDAKCQNSEINEMKNDIFLITFSEFNSSIVKNKPMSIRDMFAKQLIQLSGASLDKVAAIVEKYSTPLSLMEALEQSEEPEALLCKIKCKNSGRAIDKTTSINIARLYTWEQLNG